MTRTRTSSSPIGQVGTTSTCMDDSGGPWRSLRIAQAYMRSGTWPSGGISPISYRLFNGTGPAFALATADMAALLFAARGKCLQRAAIYVAVQQKPYSRVNRSTGSAKV